MTWDGRPEESLDVAARDLDGQQRGGGDDVGRWRLTPAGIEFLTEEIAPPEGPASLLPINADVRGAVEDQREKVDKYLNGG